jgi:hypothetical protein
MTKQIQLTKGKFATVDDEEFTELSKCKWHCSTIAGNLYAARKDKFRRTIFMHRVITNAEAGFDVDHVDGDGLNNIKSNLRVCTHSENSRNQRIRSNNTSGFKGVSRLRKLWDACIYLDGKTVHIGRYSTPIDAARAYNASAIKHFGPFARLNVLPGESK